VGGVRWRSLVDEVVIDASSATCVGVLAHALSLIAVRGSRRGWQAGIAGSVDRVAQHVEIRLAGAIDRDDTRACVDALSDLVRQSPIEIAERDAAVGIVLPAA
jgi:hypothetical protein